MLIWKDIYISKRTISSTLLSSKYMLGMRHSWEGTFGKVRLSQLSTVLCDYKWYAISRNLFTKSSESSHAHNSEVTPSGWKAERKYKKMRRHGEIKKQKTSVSQDVSWQKMNFFSAQEMKTKCGSQTFRRPETGSNQGGWSLTWLIANWKLTQMT